MGFPRLRGRMKLVFVFYTSENLKCPCGIEDDSMSPIAEDDEYPINNNVNKSKEPR